jgi:putative FmdB family regulatory protein
LSVPLYEYECREHGLFELIQSVSQSGQPAPCPACALPGARVLSVPHLCAMSRSQLLARDRNERSQYEPRVSRTPDGHVHHAAQSSPQKPAPLQAYHGRRPWVIEHS